MKSKNLGKFLDNIRHICRKSTGKKVNAINYVLFLLLWAKYIPKTEKNIIGFFDFLEPIDSFEKIINIYDELEKKLIIDFRSLFVTKNKINIQQIDEDRTELLHLAKILAKGSEREIYTLIGYLQNYKDINDPNAIYSGLGKIHYSVLGFVKKNI